jgi:formate dehydrogenase major subunit
VADPRKIDLVSSPHVKAQHHLALKPGTNVALINSLAHVVVNEGLVAKDYVALRCDDKSFNEWCAFVSKPENSPEAFESVTGVPASEVRAAARMYASRSQLGHLLRLGRDRTRTRFHHGHGYCQPRHGLRHGGS